MASNYSFIIILFLFWNIFCANSTNSTNSTKYVDKCTYQRKSEQEECFNLVQEEEKEEGYDCCFVKYKSGGSTNSYCYLLTEDEIDPYEVSLKDSGKTDVSVLCSTTKSLKDYINFGLIFLILILL